VRCVVSLQFLMPRWVQLINVTYVAHGLNPFLRWSPQERVRLTRVDRNGKTRPARAAVDPHTVSATPSHGGRLSLGCWPLVPPPEPVLGLVGHRRRGERGQSVDQRSPAPPSTSDTMSATPIA
jgi:hypothetical protein